MKFAGFGWALSLFSLVWVLGCAQNRHTAQGYSTPPDSPAEAGGSATRLPGNPAYGAYPATAEPPPLQNSAPPPPPPPSTSAADREVGAAIYRLLNNDQHLAPGAQNVTAKVYKGVVTLRGTVLSEHDRIEIVQRISQLPGVDRVDDQLELASP